MESYDESVDDVNVSGGRCSVSLHCPWTVCGYTPGLCWG